MKTVVSKKLFWCCGHRVVGHEGKCCNFHGHNYCIQLHAEAEKLDNVGRVIDFFDLKRLMKEWLAANFDHAFILWCRDELGIRTLGQVHHEQGPQRIYLLPANPTVENIAAHLLNTICPQIYGPIGVRITKLGMWESDASYVEVSL